MASFRIISTPKGQAPEEVRKEWVGIVLPLKSLGGPFPAGLIQEADFDGHLQPARDNVLVHVDIALTELEKKSPAAAQWFYENLPAWVRAGDFCFGTDEVEILES
jgi:hypothetical protein